MKHRRGFTMIEVLVACGIIVILMGLLFLGGRAIVNSNKSKSTSTTLGNLKAMVTEREAAVGGAKVLADVTGIFATATITVPVDGGLIGGLARSQPDRTPTATNHVGATQSVMRLLVAIPANKKAVANIPNEQLLETTAGGTPVLLDAFDIPILIMPGGGVTVQYETGLRTIRSPDGKPFFMSAGADGFFSVDGNSKPCGDDNLYSFEN